VSVGAVDVRVSRPQPVRAMPTASVENKSVFFIGISELVSRLTAGGRNSSRGIFLAVVRSAWFSSERMAPQTALITGASRGIGRGIALELAAAGGRIAVNYAGNAEAAHEALSLVRAAGGDGFVVQGDVAVAADRARLLEETIRHFGRIDLLVNNAGVAPKVRADILEAGEESFDRLYAISLKGPFFLTQLVAKQMLGQERDATGFRGRIVNITSISVYTASTNRGDYCIVKAGLAMMTKLFADRLANDGINVYEIRPGVIATDMTGGVKEKYDKLILEQGITPIRRWGKPADVGRAVRAIAEDRFPFSTGAVFDVDGGFHLHRL
jgi:3-oxoacyl-[acyl-carrier protein] reductase